jgi:adenosine deaminase
MGDATTKVRTGVFPFHAAHPLTLFGAAGYQLPLKTVAPPYFDTTIGGEYEVATRHFGLSEQDLRGVTRTALEAAFVDESTRRALLRRIDA